MSALNDFEQGVLDTVAEHRFQTGEHMSLRALLLSAGPEDAARLRAAAVGLRDGAYVEIFGYPNHERLALTPTGLVASKFAAACDDTVKKLLAYFHRRLATEQGKFTDTRGKT